MIQIDEGDVQRLALGDRGLQHDEAAALDEQGYVIVPSLLDSTALPQLLAEYERLVAVGPPSGQEEPGTRRGLAEMDGVFAVCWRHRTVLEAAERLLGKRFQASGVELRDPVSGHGEQPLHADTSLGLNATWFLDEFTLDNGSTRLLPGSHVAQVDPSVAGSVDPVPGEILATGAAGTLLLRHTRLLHAGGRNVTQERRRSAWAWYVHDFGRADPGAG